MSSTVIALVFNLNTAPKRLALELFYPEVNAQNDTATTTVTVKNAAPAITIQPAEVFAAGLGSTSTTPVNIGESIGFSVTADDVENNSYYLLVCTTGSTPPSYGDGVPSCNGDGNLLCVSGLTGDTVEATCTYNSVAGVPETKDWYAFACDNHDNGESDCSLSSQGSNPGVAATSSPMYINHAPVFTTGSTTVDFQPAGNNPFTFTATTTDSDVLGGPDVISYEVCSTNSWATSTGCAATTICSATTTISGGTATVSCQATTTIPMPDQAYHYWGFVKDWHQLAASSGNSVDRTYTVINTAPVVSSVVLNASANITVNMKNSVAKNVLITATISDDNSCQDLTSATSSVYLSGIAGLENCAADDDNCYQVLAASCNNTADPCNPVGDLSVSYVCSVDLAFHTIPTDNSANNSHDPNNWLAGMKGIDNNSAFGVATTASPVEMITVTALEINELSIPYGIVKGGENTGTYNATTTIINYGNSPLNSGVSGTDMGPVTIDRQRYDLTPATYVSLTNAASAINTTVDIVAPKPSTGSLDIDDSIYWGIGIVGGTASGNYSGVNSFVGELDGSVSW